MATTINAANISIGMDVTKLKEGMGASRTEISQLRSILKDSIDPVDKLKSQMVLLERAFKAGAIDADQFARSMNHLKQKVSEVNTAASGGGLQGLLKGQLGSLATMAAGAFTVSSVVGTVQEFDAIIDRSEHLGVSYRDLMIIGRTLEESGGISFDQAGQAISKMQLNLANARDKGGDLDRMLKSIGLSSRTLAGVDALSAFKEIQQAFGKIEGHANQVQFATQLFGKAGIDMIPALQTSADQFDRMEKHLREAGLLAPGLEGKISEAVDSAARLKDMFQGVALIFASEFGPMLTNILCDLKSSMEGYKNLRIAIQGVQAEQTDLDKAVGAVFDSEQLANMTAEQREAFHQEIAERKVQYIREQKALEEKRRVEKEINDAIGKVFMEKQAERDRDMDHAKKSYDTTMAQLKAKSDKSKEDLNTTAGIQKALETELQLEKQRRSAELASIQLRPGIEEEERQAKMAKAREDSAKRTAEIQQAANDATQAINERQNQDINKNLLRMTEQDMSSLESERQRLLGAGGKNVAATIAPAIKAGTVEAYKAVNQQNEERAARHEQMKRLDVIGDELKKLNSEKAVLLTRIR